MRIVKTIGIVAYFALLLPSLFLAATVWEYVAVDKMLHCWDSVGIPGDFIPPFVHDSSDHYISSPWLVHLLWGVLAVGALALPWLAVSRKFRHSITC